MFRVPPIVNVALGGAVGASLRWVVLDATGEATFPWPVLLVNLVGCAALGLLIGRDVPPSTRLLLGTGLCGGLTTFSTFSVEAVQLVRTDDTVLAVAYVLCSVVGGLAAAVIGRTAGTRIVSATC